MKVTVLKRITTGIILLLLGAPAKSAEPVPAGLLPYVQKILPAGLPPATVQLNYKKIAPTIYYVSAAWNLKAPVSLAELKVSVTPAFKPSFNWAPLLTPDSNHIIPQHIFRAPALIVSDKRKTIALIPDLDLLKKNTTVPWFLDMDALANRLIVGLGQSRVKEHVLYEKGAAVAFPKGTTTIGFYIIVSDRPEAIRDPWRAALHFMWNKWGAPLYDAGEPLHHTSLEPYVKQTYEWAFMNWRKPVWQEFELNGKQVGAPAFIVNVTQSPDYPGIANEREFRSVWNQAWFNSLRSAQGLYRYATRTGNDSLKQLALKTKELALAFPQVNGFFKSVVATEMKQVLIDGKKYNRSKGWNTLYFANSNRNPFTGDPRQSPYHIADMSFTAYWMLVWYNELEKDGRLLEYATHYAEALLKLQDAAGFFPAWLGLDDFKPMHYLDQSPETSVSITFLLQLYRQTRERRYFVSAVRAMQAVLKNSIPLGKWEDFETYWSCSRVGSDNWVGKKIARNNMFKQNTLSVFWTAQALLELYKITEDPVYLRQGQRTLDELLMYQATWQPPFIAVHSLGGFGVMNGDAEWNDSRQSLFAGLIIEYGKLLKNKEYLQRGLSALRASFTMMYTPLNPASQQQWQARWPFFGPKDYGFMMENYGHDGVTNDKGLGIGEFTIYDWGNGAAAEAYNRLYDKYGEAFMKGDF